MDQIEDIKKNGIDTETAREILDLDEVHYFEKIMPLAKQLRHEAFGNEVSFCTITNAKSGACIEDCGFCAQSANYKQAPSPVYPLMSTEKILEKAKEAESIGGTEFSIVTSGRGMNKQRELDTIVDAITQIRQQTDLETCASLGLMQREDLQKLKDAGMIHYHHNIETARSYFPNVVTSHSWEEEVETVKLAKEMGFEVCCGGIMGMGENKDQRIEFIFQLKEIDPDSIPLNFLNPRPGTPMAHLHDLTPLDCLKLISVIRLAMPEKELFICGGKEVNLQHYQDKIYDAGASGAMIGNYLTTQGRSPQQELALAEKLGFKPVGPHRKVRSKEDKSKEDKFKVSYA
ncbi:MAG: biotin synthase BioB [Deltaproteobacteria bacterium]|nr:biotin synthase BioB [Deltaproteobacteria bacterium]